MPNVKDGKIETTLHQASEWLFYQGTLNGGRNQFQVFSCFNKAYNTVKWEQVSNNVKMEKYV